MFRSPRGAERPLGVCIAGDVLFAGSIGRTDLPGGSYEQMLDSLRRQVPDAARRDGRAARPRPRHDDRPRARHEPVPRRGRRPARPGGRTRPRTATRRPRAVSAVSGIAGASRPASLSGFPSGCRPSGSSSSTSWTPIRRVFELHGFASLETRAVEPLETLTRKGEIDKEVYVLRRLHADEDEAAGARPALRPDGAVRPVRPGARGASWTSPSAATRSRRSGGASAPRTAATGSSPRPTSTSSTGTPWPSTTRWRSRWWWRTPCAPCRSRRCASRSTTASWCEGFCPGRRCRRPRRRAAGDGQARQDRPGGGRRAAAVRGRPRGERPRRAASRSPRSPPRTRPSPTGSAPWASTTRCSTRGWPSWSRVVEAAAEHAPGLVRRRPADRPRARLLHRHRVRDPAARPRGPRLDLLGRPLRRAGLGRPRDLSRGRHLDRRLPAARPGASAAASSPRRARCRPACWSRSPHEDSRRSADRTAAVLRARGIATEVAPSAAKFGKQIRHADRRGIPYVWFAGADGEPDSVKDIRSGEQSPADPETWSPPAADLVPQLEEPTP